MPVQLPPSSTFKGERILKDRLCGRCDYNLKGLRVGDPCPECGAVIQGATGIRGIRDNLADAPMSYLRSLVLGCWCMAAGVVVAIIGTFVAMPRLANWYGPGFAALGSAAWVLGVWIVTQRERHNAPADAELADRYAQLRWVNRISQSGWAIASLILLIWAGFSMAQYQAQLVGGTPVPTWPAQLAAFGYWGVVLIALLGLAPLCVQIASIADWAGHTDLSARLRVSAWGIGGGGIMVAVGTFGGPLFGPARFFAGWMIVLGGIAMVAGWGTFLWSVISLANTVSWAISSAHERAASNLRIREKVRDRFAPPPSANPPPAKPAGKPEADDGTIPLA